MKVLIVVCLAFSIFFDVVVSDVGTCPDGWTKAIDSCYMIFTDQMYTAYEALDGCVAKGARLVSIETLDENEWITGELTAKGVSAWTSGYYLLDDEKTSGWYWEGKYDNGVPIGNTGFNWDDRQPNMKEKGEACVIIGKDGYWDDVSCLDQFGFICELD